MIRRNGRLDEARGQGKTQAFVVVREDKRVAAGARKHLKHIDRGSDALYRQVGE